MAKFRLLHITDLHISLPPPDDLGSGELALWLAMQATTQSRARRPMLEAVAALAFHLRQTIDTFVLSGDLADDGEERNLDAASSFVDEPAAPGLDYLAADRFPTLHDPARMPGSLFILPGNHDRFRGALARLPGGSRFDQYFGSYWRVGLGGVQALTLTKPDARLALIAGDMCLRRTGSAVNMWGAGLAYRDTIDGLVAKTARIRATHPAAGILWVLHFPPLRNVEASLELKRAPDVIDAAQAADVKYIIAGHLHRDQRNNYDRVEVICTGSAASEMHAHYGNSVRLIEVDVGAQGELTLAHTIYRYDPGNAAFAPA